MKVDFASIYRAFVAISPGEQEPLLSKLTDTLFEALDEGLTTSAFEIARLGHVLQPQDPWWLYRYAEGLRQIGRLTEAEPLLLDVHPRKTKNRYLVEVSLGQLYRDSGRLEEAELWFRRATETAAGDTAPWVYLGGFLARCERFAEACSALERGLEAKGDLDEIWLNLGLNKRGLGDYQAAKECFEVSIKMSPSYAAALAALADVNRAIEIRAMNDLAIDAWRRAKSME